MSDTATHARGLVRKLAEVMAAVERVPKRGRNEFHRYDYATEADIVTVVRQELASRQVMLIPEVVAHERQDITTKKNERGDPLSILTMRFTFIDGETGEMDSRMWLGVGQDGGDKGIYKAMTGAAKYFLMKTFLMPTGDDPENDAKEVKQKAREDTRSADKEAKGQQKADAERIAASRPAAPIISDLQRQQLVALVGELGWRKEDVQRLLAAHGFKKSTDVTVDKLPAILEALRNGDVVPPAPVVGEVAPPNTLPI
jgi:hypothetical protein